MPLKSRKSSSQTRAGPASAMYPSTVDSKRFIIRLPTVYRLAGMPLLTRNGRRRLLSFRRTRPIAVSSAEPLAKFLRAKHLNSSGQFDEKARIDFLAKD